jgi:hypothetical protein
MYPLSWPFRWPLQCGGTIEASFDGGGSTVGVVKLAKLAHFIVKLLVFYDMSLTNNRLKFNQLNSYGLWALMSAHFSKCFFDDW